MTKFQSTAVPALFILLTSIGLGYGALAPQSKPDDDKPKAEPKETAAAEAPESDEARPEIIKSGDILIVEVLAPLPGLPISGKYVVRRDGKLALGFYGDVDAAHLTPPMVKEKIAGHLRRFASDQALGLMPGADPKDNDRIYVVRVGSVFDEAVDESGDQYCYLLGEFEEPGPIRITGRGQEKIVDVLNRAGGLTPRADHDFLQLITGGSKDVPRSNFPIHVGEILSGKDMSTNYVVQPGDRLLAWPDANLKNLGAKAPKPAPSPSRPPMALSAPANPPADESKLQAIDRRLSKIESQLAEILKRLEDR